MTEMELYGEVRTLIGKPSVNEVPNRDLKSYLVSSLELLAEELKYVVRTDAHFALAAGVQEYPLPSDCGWIVWVEWNGSRLDPASTYKWDRDGTNWRAAAASTPREYAVQGRNLILNPPPDSGSVTTDPELTIRHIGLTAGIAPGGPPYLSELDQWLAIYEAAALYCAAHPSDENQMRIAEFEKQIGRRMALAKKRAQAPLEEYYPRHAPRSSRLGGAR